MAYPLERKEAILNKLLPPSSKAIAEVAKEEGIPIGTIYAWQSKAKQAGVSMPRNHTKADNWSAKTKLSIVALLRHYDTLPSIPP